MRILGTELPDEADEAGKRASEIVNLAVIGGHATRWIALRLSDGGSDGVIYDTRADAVTHQIHETQCAYVCITPDGWTPRVASRYLVLHRTLYDAGFKLSDPARQPISPMRREAHQQ